MRYFLLLSIFSMACYAELVIEITQGAKNEIPIAVVPFKWMGKGELQTSIHQVVRDDFIGSGYFSVLPVEGMLSFPNSIEEIFYGDWRLLKQDYLVLGSISFSQKEKKFVVIYQLVDVNSKEVLINHKLTAGLNALRDIAHKISDEIYQSITHVPGIFSTKLVYVTHDTQRKKFQLNYSDLDGARQQTILSSNEPIISPAWSRDGRSIAYVSFENGRSEVFMQELATGARKKLASFNGINSAPAFSPDGKKIAMVLSKKGNPDIYILTLSSKKLTRVTTHYGIDTEPQWMPDGRSLVFTSSRSGSVQIYQVELNNLKVKRLTFDGSYNARARITPDGEKMVMLNGKGGEFYIAVQSLVDNGMQVLSRHTQLDESPSIAPNGQMIVYATHSEGKNILAIVSIDGEVRFKLPVNTGHVKEPAWSPFLN